MHSKYPIILLASVLLIACEQEDLTFDSGSSSSRSTTITLTAQPPTDEDVISLTLSTFGTQPFSQGPTDSDTLIHVTDIPSPCTLWQGHVVALVDPLEPSTRGRKATDPSSFAAGSQATVPGASASGPYQEARILLLSTSEWTDLPSALNVTNPTTALAIPTTYSEGPLKDWHIPTAAEAKALKNAYVLQSSGQVPGSSTFDSLNALLASIAAPTILATDEKGAPIRYLCEEATRSFSFAPGTTISVAGTKATTYRLRLVKTLHLKLKR